jgi:competence protein ComEC
MGDKVVLDGGIYIDVYWPSLQEIQDENQNSLVFELIHGENEFLFTGDATIETELKLLQLFGEKLDSDVLKVGHHGSKTSTSQLFLETVSPDFSILSYGENSYGHPHEEVLDKLQDWGGEIFHTKNRGTIVARSDGSDILFQDPSLFQSFVGSVLIDSFNAFR